MKTYAIILAALGLWSFIRRQIHRLAETRFEIRLFELRDNLRAEAINGNINANSPIFAYLDSTISMLIREKYYLTFWRVFALNVKHTQEQEIMELKTMIENGLNESPVYLETHKEMSKVLTNYVMEQHAVSFWIFKRIYDALRFNRQILSLLTFPETSAANKIRTSPASSTIAMMQHA